jgi:hypothetical protein
MAIAKKPNVCTLEISNKKEEAFISGAKSESPKEKRQKKQPIMIRFDQGLLTKVDETSRRRGVSRSSWIQYVISRAIDNGEG